MADGPLILGATGRVGRAFRALAAAGLWPGPEPVWHGRDSLWAWDMAGPAPALPGRPRGVIVLAGATQDGDLAANSRLALAALDLARARGLWPVLACSSGAVYGRAATPRREEDGPQEANAYGLAKWQMEQDLAAATRPGEALCCLRLANVAGCDALFGAMARGPVVLDRFADGRTPRRSYVGPLMLARALTGLIGLHVQGVALPAVLNLAQPGVVAMDAVLEAAGAPWHPQPAPPGALPQLSLDGARLAVLLPLPPATPDALVAEARAAGWSLPA
jgi:hypothetical protein